jgi:hypothetical protein
MTWLRFKSLHGIFALRNHKHLTGMPGKRLWRPCVLTLIMRFVWRKMILKIVDFFEKSPLPL